MQCALSGRVRKCLERDNGKQEISEDFEEEKMIIMGNDNKYIIIIENLALTVPAGWPSG